MGDNPTSVRRRFAGALVGAVAAGGGVLFDTDIVASMVPPRRTSQLGVRNQKDEQAAVVQASTADRPNSLSAIVRARSWSRKRPANSVRCAVTTHGTVDDQVEDSKKGSKYLVLLTSRIRPTCIIPAKATSASGESIAFDKRPFLRAIILIEEPSPRRCICRAASSSSWISRS